MKTKKELLKSPERKWDDTSKLYDAVLIVPAGTKHDSGFMHIAIIGVTLNGKEETYEICGYADDISLIADIDTYGDIKMAKVRMDCYYPQGILRYHGRCKFKVSEALSSMYIIYV